MSSGSALPVSLDEQLAFVLSPEWGSKDPDGWWTEEAYPPKPLLAMPMLPERVELALHAGDYTAAVALCVHVAREPKIWNANGTILWFLRPSLLVLERLLAERSPMLSADFGNVLCHAVIAVDWIGGDALALAEDQVYDDMHDGPRYGPRREPLITASQTRAKPTRDDVDLLIASSQRCWATASRGSAQPAAAEALAILRCMANLCAEWLRLPRAQPAGRAPKRSRSRSVPHRFIELLDEAESFASQCGADDALTRLREARNRLCC